MCHVLHVRRVCGGLLLLALALIPRGGSAQAPGVDEGNSLRVDARRRDAKLLVNLEQVAAKVGWSTKLVDAERLVVLCREARDAVCIPIRLGEVDHCKTPDGLYIESPVIERVLHVRFAENPSGQVVMQRLARPATSDDQVRALNASWGPDRGFRVGQTVPDIPLVDLQGREVRFSDFLGKRYIIYCWASW